MTKTERTEAVVQVLILIGIAGMAGAASFTHVHDWTMRNAPSGTGSWFGWANAVISELTPTAAGIDIRRRKRHHQPVTYPMAVLIAAAVLSLAAQVAEAKPGLAGWISSAVPALAFLALTKLVLSRPGTSRNTGNTEGEPSSVTATTPNATSAPAAENPTPTPAAAPAAATLTPDRLHDLRPVPSGQLLISARMTAFAHQQETGRPITADELAARLSVPPALAGSLLDHLGGTTPPSVTAVNGTVIDGSRP